MVYTKNPQTKIKRIIKYLSKDYSHLLVEQVASNVEQKFGVGVFINYGRITGHMHEFEIYKKFKQDWVALLCRVEIPYERFKKPLDF